METEHQQPVYDERKDSDLVGINGWLLLCLILLILSAVNVVSLPYSVSIFNWRALWSASQTLTIYFIFSFLIQFAAGVCAGVTAVLILSKRKVAIATVTAYCLLICAESIVGIITAQPIFEAITKIPSIINIGNYCRYSPFVSAMNLERIIMASIYFGYAIAMGFAVIVYLYFHRSERVKATLTD